MSWFRLLMIVIGSIFMDFAVLFGGFKLLKKKINLNLKTITALIILLAITTANYILSDVIVRIVVFYLVIMLFYRLLFNEEYSKCAFAAFISYLLVFLNEIIYGLMILLLSKNGQGLLPDKLNNYEFLVANFFISAMTTIILSMFAKVFSKIMIIVTKNAKRITYFLWILIIATVAALFSKITSNQWMKDENFWANIIILFGVIIVAFTIIKQSHDKKKLEDRYDEFVKYAANTEKLLEQYRVAQHENINELIIIKSLVNKKNFKLLEYLKQVLNEKDNIENKWINDLKYLPFDGLKGVMHYKISEMKENDIDVHINISKTVQDSKLIDAEARLNENICKIICVFLDNAKEAVAPLKDKSVFIEIYCQNNQIVFEIANNYVGSVNIESINEKGTSTKGKGRGYGLYIVQNILERTSRLEHETHLKEDLFVQKLTIK